MSSAAPAPATAPVTRGSLSALVALDGSLTRRARPDGSPYPVIDQARGTYTALPAVGDRVACGDVLLRVDDRPVLLLCGPVPAYRDLHLGDRGRDVEQLNANLHALGHDAAAGVALAPEDDTFDERTASALDRLRAAAGLDATVALALGEVVFLPEPVRVAAVHGELGGPAQPGTTVLAATSDELEVQVDLEAWRQSEVRVGDRARITLPGNRSTTGVVGRLGTVEAPAAAPAPGQGAGVAAATIPVSIELDDPDPARGLDQAPVRVEVTTAGVDDVLSVPVTAIVGRSGGGYAVEVLRGDGRRDQAAVELGLFDTGAGRVQVVGDVREGDLVVVPSS